LATCLEEQGVWEKLRPDLRAGSGGEKWIFLATVPKTENSCDDFMRALMDSTALSSFYSLEIGVSEKEAG